MQKKFDLYLSRASSLVQIGLFAVAIATIFYTVIPLYKAAQMEESLARKEAEYQVLSKKVEDLYVMNRRWEVSNLAALSMDCLGWDSVIHEAKFSFSWDDDIANCLDAELKAFSGGSLNRRDISSLSKKFKIIAEEVLSLRKFYQRRYESYESDLANDAALAPKNKPMLEKFDSLGLSIGISRKELDSELLKSNIKMGRAEIVLEFLGKATDIVKTMNDTDWVGSESND